MENTFGLEQTLQLVIWPHGSIFLLSPNLCSASFLILTFPLFLLAISLNFFLCFMFSFHYLYNNDLLVNWAHETLAKQDQQWNFTELEYWIIQVVLKHFVLLPVVSDKQESVPSFWHRCKAQNDLPETADRARILVHIDASFSSSYHSDVGIIRFARPSKFVLCWQGLQLFIYTVYFIYAIIIMLLKYLYHTITSTSITFLYNPVTHFLS